MAKVRTGSKLNKSTDTLETIFKVGRKKASFKEAYQVDKGIFSKIDVSRLSQQDRSYYNKVKAGKARAANGIKNSAGKYIDRTYSKQIETRLKGVAKTAGFDNVNQLRQGDKELYEATLNLEKLQLKYSYQPENLLQNIEKFKGRIIRERGDGTKEDVSKSQAINIIQRSVSAIRNKYDVFHMSVEITIENEGELMTFKMPTPAEIDEQGEEIEDWEYDNIELYGSEKPLPKKEIDARKKTAKAKAAKKSSKAKKPIHRR